MIVRPIIFSGAMIPMVLDDRKTQTRRVVTAENSLINGHPGGYGGMSKRDVFVLPEFLGEAWVDPGPSPAGNPGPYLKCPIHFDDTIHRVYCKYQPGDELWVRETWYSATKNIMDNCLLGYRADGDHPHGQAYYIKPSIHMPRWASRIQLRVKAVRVERVQEISEKDAVNEGVLSCWDGMATDRAPFPDAIEKFTALWNSINTKRGFGWDVNPLVWVIEFERMG